MSEDLLRRLRERDTGAQRELFAYCATRLRPFLLVRLPDTGELDDCVSEVFTRALEGIRAGRDPRVLEAWLFGIAKNVLKDRYEAKRMAAAELPDDLPAPSVDSPLELDDAHLPDRISDYEARVGKRQLWDLLLTATNSLSPGLAPVMRAHMELTRRRGHKVAGKELADALGQPVDIVNRQLNRGMGKMLTALVPLMLARSGGSSCPALAGLLREILRPEQLRDDRKPVLDASQAAAVHAHADTCATCAPHVAEARDFSRYALGPGLLTLADDDDERRRAVLAVLDRAGDEPAAAQASTAAAVTAIPAPLIAEAPLAGRSAGIVERVRTAVAARVATMPGANAAVRFAQENPEVLRRVVVGVTSGVAAVALILGAVAADRPNGHEAVADGKSPTTTGTAPPGEEHASGGSDPAGPASASTGGRTSSGGTGPAGERKQPAGPGTGSPTSSNSAADTDTTSQPPPPTDTIDVDFSDTDYHTFGVTGVTGTFSTAETQHLRLDPGSHTLTTPLGQKFDFRVTSAHRVAYDPALEGMFTGAGSSALVVHGFRITLDASDVDESSIGIGGISQTAQRRHTYRLLPGTHYLLVNNARSYLFTVTPDGHVTYDPGLRGRLTGAGGATLALHGLPVTVDVTDTAYDVTGVGGTAGTRDRRHVYRLLPGPQYMVILNQFSYHFAVTDDGHVTYDPGLQGPLTGAGSTTLGMHGFSVVIDATRSGAATFSLSGAGGFDARQRQTFRLLPATHVLTLPGGRQIVFRVNESGHVEYDHGLDDIVSGWGSSTLTVRGT